jgi:hypothetical protein
MNIPSILSLQFPKLKPIILKYTDPFIGIIFILSTSTSLLILKEKFNVDSISTALLTLIGTFVILGLPIISAFSDFESNYGASLLESIRDLYAVDINLKELIYDSFLAICMLIILTLIHPEFLNQPLKLKIFTSFFLGLEISFTLYFCVNYYKFIEIIIELHNPYSVKNRLENLLLDSQYKNWDKIVKIIGYRIQWEKLYFKIKPSFSEDWLKIGISNLITKLLEKNIKHNEETNITKVKILTEHFIKLMPYYLETATRQYYIVIRSSLIYTLKKIISSSQSELSDNSIKCVNTFYNTALEMYERTSGNQELSIATQPVLPLKAYISDTPARTIDYCDNYYRIASQFYSIIIKYESTIFEEFVKNLNILSLGNKSLETLLHSNINDYKIIQKILQAGNYIKTIKILITSRNELINDNSISTTPKNFIQSLSQYYHQITLERLLRVVISNMMHYKKYRGVFRILNIHSPLDARSTNAGVNFISYNIYEHVLSQELNELYFADNIDTGQSKIYFSYFIGFLIIFNTLRESPAHVVGNCPNANIADYSLGITRLEHALSFINSDQWTDCFKDYCSIKNILLKNLKESSVQAAAEFQQTLNSKINSIKSSAALSPIEKERYQNEINNAAITTLGRLPLYKNLKNVENGQIKKLRKVHHQLKREALIENTGTYHVFNRGNNIMLDYLHTDTVYAYITKFGHSLTEIKNVLVNLKTTDIIFIAFDDKETLGNILEQEIFTNITLPNGTKCEVKTLPCQTLSKYWIYKGESIFRVTKDLIEFKFEDTKNEDNVILIESSYSIEPIDDNINQAVIKELNIHLANTN